MSNVCLIKQIDFGLSVPKKVARRVYLDSNKRTFLIGQEAKDFNYSNSILKQVNMKQHITKKSFF